MIPYSMTGQTVSDSLSFRRHCVDALEAGDDSAVQAADDLVSDLDMAGRGPARQSGSAGPPSARQMIRQ